MLAQAVAGMRLGRIDAETTANLGVIEGGVATNIVPNRVRIRGETRSLSVEKLEAQTAHMRGCFEAAAAGCDLQNSIGGSKLMLRENMSTMLRSRRGQ